MSKKIQIKLDFDQDLTDFMQLNHPQVVDFRIISESLDARGAPNGKKPVNHFHLEVIETGESFSEVREEFKKVKGFTERPIIIGAGPAGLFAALRFAEYGIGCDIIERGDVANKRMLHISKYWRKGQLNTENNVCFGEGGAGLFSDGKLITRVKSSYIKYVMQSFVDFGAPAEVAYLSNPHLGSNKIRQLISKITDHLKDRDCRIIYNNAVKELVFEDKKVTGVSLKDGTELKSPYTILATGHSAEDIYEHLAKHDVAMTHKDFAVGVRIEHPREVIDKLQHGEYAVSDMLGTARYRLSHHDKESSKGTYSFCMCPGGYVLSSGTTTNGIVVNGMSNYARNSRWSNSALVVTVNQGTDFDKTEVLSGLKFQHKIEQKAFQVSTQEADGRMLPAMTVAEFLSGKLNDDPLPKTSCPSGLFKTDIRKIFPAFINDHLKNGLIEFNKKIKNFSSGEAVLIAPETRTSAPVTVLRDKLTMVSTSTQGLYPCGEGAGYAGGITSAAADGIKVVEAILAPYKD